ncbi:MAG TPA: cytochrome P450, partial [Anaerolineae bacterium]|nr:cytochrome P450 [Anaerolineae bacterium]
MPHYDLFSPTFKADPHTTFAAMRHDCPIYAHKDQGGRTLWYFTRYEDVIAVMRDPRFIKDASKLRDQPTNKKPTLAQAINRNMLFADPPDHTRLRGLVNLAFTPRRIAGMADKIEATCHGLIDQFVGDGSAELITAYALPL